MRELENPERLLVAVGSSPSSAYLVRWAVRHARATGGECQAVYVDMGTRPGPRERQRLDDNLCLARTLGARVDVLPGGDLAAAIIETAKERGTTLIVVGRSGFPRRRLLLTRQPVSERIVRNAGSIAVVVVQDSMSPPFAQPLSFHRHSAVFRPARYLIIAAVFVAFSAAAQVLALPFVSYRSVALLYLAAILGLSFIASPAVVAGCAVLSALTLNYFFIPPYYTFSIGLPEDWILFATYFLVAFVTGGLVARLRSREKMLSQRQRAAAFLLHAGEKLAPCSSTASATDQAASLACEYFQLSVSFFVCGPGGETDAVAEAGATPLPYDEFVAAALRATGGVISEVAIAPEGRMRIIPAALSGERVGVVAGIGLPSGRVWTVSDDELLSSLGKTLALIVERERSEESSRRSAFELRSQRFAKVLLDSVSHEIRTPLTTITGSLSALRDDTLAEKPEPRKAILEGALEASASLNRIVEDLLSAGRIESGVLKPKRMPADPAEIAEFAVGESGAVLKGRKVLISLPPNSRQVEVDASLVSRLAANLLRNAGKYSLPEGSVELRMEEIGRDLVVSVSDCGPGVKRDRMESLFEKFKRGDGQLPGGLGLGLSICKGIAEAHGGRISARSEPGNFTVEAVFPGCVVDAEDGDSGGESL